MRVYPQSGHGRHRLNWPWLADALTRFHDLCPPSRHCLPDTLIFFGFPIAVKNNLTRFLANPEIFFASAEGIQTLA